MLQQSVGKHLKNVVWHILKWQQLQSFVSNFTKNYWLNKNICNRKVFANVIMSSTTPYLSKLFENKLLMITFNHVKIHSLSMDNATTNQRWTV